MSDSTFTVAGNSTAGQGGAAAWVLYSTNTGVAVILASYNIASVVRDALGQSTVTFAVPFSTANYCVVSGVGGTGTGGGSPYPVSIQTPIFSFTPTNSSISISVGTSVSGPADAAYISLAFFGV